MKIAAILCDPLETLKYQSDSTILLAEELQARGYRIFQFTPDDLRFIDGAVKAKGSYVRFTYDPQNFFIEESKATLDLTDASLILIRHDPPYDMRYLTPVHLLRLIEDKVKIVNKPSALINNPEKISVGLFPELMPDTVINPSIEDIAYLLKKHERLILKPLYGHGGNGIIQLNSEADLHQVDVKTFLNRERHIVAQEYLPNVVEGDKRVMMLYGEVIAVMRRIPASGSFLANLAAGGHAQPTELTSKEMQIVHKVGAYLKSVDVCLAGVDLIDQKLIEINITSPTGLKMLNTLYGKRYEKQIIDAIIL